MLQSFAIKCKSFQLKYMLAEIKKALDAGLVFGGKNEDGILYIGENRAWDKFNYHNKYEQ